MSALSPPVPPSLKETLPASETVQVLVYTPPPPTYVDAWLVLLRQLGLDHL